MSLASVSAASAQPEPSDEGMADLGGDVRLAHAADAEGGAVPMTASEADFPSSEIWAAMTSKQRKNFAQTRNKKVARGDCAF